MSNVTNIDDQIEILNLELKSYRENEIYKLITEKIANLEHKIADARNMSRNQKNEIEYNKKINEVSSTNEQKRELETLAEQNFRTQKSAELRLLYSNRKIKYHDLIEKEFLEIFDPIVKKSVGMSYYEAVQYLKKNGLIRIEDYTNGGNDNIVLFRTKLFCTRGGVVRGGYIEF